MGRDVRLGKGVEEGEVGNGANVTVPKLNKGVGVAPIPSLGNTMGLGNGLEGLRDGSKLTTAEHRQQNASKINPGKRTLPTCPCWS